MSGRIDWISKLLASAVFVFKHLAAHDSNINHVHPDHPYAHFFPYHRFPHEYHGRRQHRSGIGLEESSIHPPGRVALTRRWKKAYIGHTLWQIDHEPYARLLYRHFPRCSYPAVTRWMSSILPDVSEMSEENFHRDAFRISPFLPRSSCFSLATPFRRISHHNNNVAFSSRCPSYLWLRLTRTIPSARFTVPVGREIVL